MVTTIYVESEIEFHPRTEEIVGRFPKAEKILCDRYTEVFNPKSQNFRLQKTNPALILAKKHKGYVLPTPPDYGVGGDENYYFSHMLNCVYDCRYCFLQGMYSSANYVVFVNYEDFTNQILSQSESSDVNKWFFSGYDCDSLAFEPILLITVWMYLKGYLNPVWKLELKALRSVRYYLVRHYLTWLLLLVLRQMISLSVLSTVFQTLVNELAP